MPNKAGSNVFINNVKPAIPFVKIIKYRDELNRFSIIYSVKGEYNSRIIKKIRKTTFSFLLILKISKLIKIIKYIKKNIIIEWYK